MKIVTVPEFLLDTNIIIETFWGKEPVASLVESWIKEGVIAMSVVTVAEILSKANKREKEKLSLLTNKFGAFSIDITLAEIAGNYRKEFSRKKTRVYLLDCFVAATAKLYNLKLVTKNVKDYPMKDVEIIDPRDY